MHLARLTRWTSEVAGPSRRVPLEPRMPGQHLARAAMWVWFTLAANALTIGVVVSAWRGPSWGIDVAAWVFTGSVLAAILSGMLASALRPATLTLRPAK